MFRSSLPHVAIVASCLAVVFSVGCAQAAERTIVLKEHLDRAFQHEFVAYPQQFAKGECLADSISLTGPGGPVACQLDNIELWPGSKHVKSADLAFVVAKLAPLATHQYTFSYGAAPTKAAVKTDLKVVEAGAQVELLTSRFGIRLPLGGKQYPQPAALAGVPGPVLGVKIGDAWVGGEVGF